MRKHGKCKGIVWEVYWKYWKGIGRMEKCMKSIGSVWEGKEVNEKYLGSVQEVCEVYWMYEK